MSLYPPEPRNPPPGWWSNAMLCSFHRYFPRKWQSNRRQQMQRRKTRKKQRRRFEIGADGEMTAPSHPRMGGRKSSSERGPNGRECASEEALRHVSDTPPTPPTGSTSSAPATNPATLLRRHGRTSPRVSLPKSRDFTETLPFRDGAFDILTSSLAAHNVDRAGGRLCAPRRYVGGYEEVLTELGWTEVNSKWGRAVVMFRVWPCMVLKARKSE
ncbi:hypothetical protein B0H13DRAFT_2559135 [Mycena leptocephala]|nr:hypothetical protein B0H13DRAFT_2559135 [Mycena leptocephala]